MARLEQNLRLRLQEMQISIERGDQIRDSINPDSEQDVVELANELAQVSEELSEQIRAYRRALKAGLVTVEDNSMLCKEEVQAIVDHVFPDPQTPDRKATLEMGLIAEYIKPYKIEGLHLSEITLSPSQSGSSSDLVFVEKLPGLRKITASNYPKETSYPDFRKLAELEEVILDRCSTGLPAQLLGITGITRVTLSSCQVKQDSLEPGALSHGLTSFSAPTNGIRSLEPFLHLKKLKVLNLSDNPIDSLEGVEKIPDLETVGIAHTKIVDLAPLLDLPQLKRVMVEQPTGLLAGRRNRSVLAKLRKGGVEIKNIAAR